MTTAQIPAISQFKLSSRWLSGVITRADCTSVLCRRSWEWASWYISVTWWELGVLYLFQLQLLHNQRSLSAEGGNTDEFRWISCWLEPVLWHYTPFFSPLWSAEARRQFTRVFKVPAFLPVGDQGLWVNGTVKVFLMLGHIPPAAVSWVIKSLFSNEPYL